MFISQHSYMYSLLYVVVLDQRVWTFGSIAWDTINFFTVQSIA